MRNRLGQRCLSGLLALVLLLGLLPDALAEPGALCMQATSSVSHLYVGEGPVQVTAALSGGSMPYTVTFEAIRDAAVIHAETVTAEETTAAFSFVPDRYGDYQLIVRVRDGQGVQQLTAMALYVAEHEQESWADWESSVSGADLSGGWGQRLLSVARTQLGYGESEKDFIIKNGEKQHYSRYGAWFGLPYGGWNNAFLAFAANCANLPADALSGANCSSWIAGMRRKRAYMEPGSGYVPAAGDVAFLGGGRAAVVESTDGVNVTVIEGDADGTVARRSYALARLAGVGNMGLLMGLHSGAATAVPEGGESAPSATPEPTAPPPTGEEELVFRATPTPPPGRTAAPRDDADPLTGAAGAIADQAEALNAAATGVPRQFSEAYALAREGMRALAARYLRRGETTAEEIAAFVTGLSRGEVYYIFIDMEDLALLVREAGLTDYEANALFETEFAFAQLERAVTARWAQLSVNRDTDAVYTPIADAPGLTVTVELSPAAGTNALATTAPTENGLSVELRGGKRTFGGYNYAAATLTVANGTEEDAILSFAWQATDVYALTIDGLDSVLCENPFQRKLNAGDSFTVEMQTGQDGTTNILTLTGFALGAQAAVPQIAVQYDAAQGQVLADGKEIASGASVDATVACIEAVPAEGMRFVAWVDAATQKLLSQEAQYVPPMAENAGVQAIFAADDNSSPALFLADGMLFSDLNVACQAQDATVILISGGTLPAGNHAVSAGKTLLIPFDADCTDPGNRPNVITGACSGTVSVFRTLKIPADAALTVEGTLTVGGSQNMDSAPVSGCSDGPCGCIDMAEGSRIILAEDGVLQAWGLISGQGEVIVRSGATVREAFQLQDWCGAAFPRMLERQEWVYPFSQYRVQNIEVALRLLAGAQSEALLAVILPTDGLGVFAVHEPVPLVGGEGSLFALTSGSLTRTLDSGRMHFTLSGDAAMTPFTLSIAGKTLDSAACDLPINGSMAIEAATGTLAIRQDLLLQTGAELIIREGASCVLEDGRRIILCGGAAEGGVLLDGELNQSEGASASLYAEAGGAGIRSTGTGKLTLTAGGETTFYRAAWSGDEVTYTAAEIVNVRLRNADGSLVPLENPGVYPIENGIPGPEIAWATGATVSYTYTGGRWSIPCTESVHYGSLTGRQLSSCTEGGSMTLVCSCNPGVEQSFDLPATGHQWQAAACTEPRSCTACGLTEDAPLGHSWEALGDSIPATCEAEGSQTLRCARCQAEDIRYTPALGHTPVTDAAVDATCTEPGLTEGAHCGSCGEILAERQEIAAPGHSYLSVETAPSCTADGFTTHTCTACGDCYTDSLIPAGHTWKGAGATVTEPGCTTPGLRASDACSVCGATQDEVEIPALGHSYMADGAPVESLGRVIQTADCERPVIREYACTRDGCGCTEQIAGEPLGHDLQQHEGRAPTCTEAGWDAYAACQRDGCEYTTYAPLEAAGHTETQIPAVAASCTESGSTAGTKCTACGLILTEPAVVPAAGHRFPAGQEGANCISRSCTVCQESVAAAAEHDYASVTTPATCTAPGFTLHTCALCGGSYSDAPTQAKGHAMDEGRVTREATCTQEGEMIYTCRNEGCSHTRTESLPAGHAVVTDPGLAATCEAEGLSEGRHCSRCGEVLLAQTVLPGGHIWSAPPCADGSAHCQRCGLTNAGLLPHALPGVSCTAPQICGYGCGHTVASPGHDRESVEAIPALCASDGWTSGWSCARCGEGDEPKRIPALGHGIVQHEARKATYTGAGWAAYEACIRCAYSTRVEIPALGVQVAGSYEELLAALPWLENWAADYAPAEALPLVIGYLAGAEEAFTRYVYACEHEENQQRTDLLNVSGLQGLTTLLLPNGETADMAALFAMLNAAAGSRFAAGETDAAGWAGVLAQLLTDADHPDHDALLGAADGDPETLVSLIRENLLGGYEAALRTATDGCLLLQNLDCQTWQPGDLAALFSAHFTATLSDSARAKALLEGRFGSPATRSAAREAVHAAYAGNSAAAALEAVHTFRTADPDALRRAVCHAFADYLCDLAGGYAGSEGGLTVTGSDFTSLAPGISLETHRANTADGRQLVYYLAFADAGRADVSILANYASREPASWQSATVLAQAEAAQVFCSDPSSDGYTEHFRVVAAINGGGFASGGVPTGLLVMHGERYHAIDGGGFFGVTKAGRPVIGTMQEYNISYRDQLAEGVGACGTMLVKDGGIAVTGEDASRDSRSAVGITSGGRVVFLTLDGAQEPWSCGATLLELAQILQSVGCTRAISLDGGGSATLVARRSAGLQVINRPSQGAARSVGASLIMVSTAPEGEGFDRAVIQADQSAVTVGATLRLTAVGLTASGAETALPAGTVWAVSDESVGIIRPEGLFTAKAAGTVEAQLLLYGAVLAGRTLQVTAPAADGNVLTWQRSVSNGVGEGSTYYITDLAGDMVTAYDLTLDLTRLPIPERMGDLMYMLPGLEADTASTWDFLCQQAERISGLTRIVLTLAFDPGLQVDRSALEVSGDCFTLEQAAFDAAANTLTLTLAWIPRTAPVASADPHCRIAGIRLTPRDAAWDANDRFNPVNRASVSCAVYMRASGLYTFAQDAANQAAFGLCPYEAAGEQGAYFSDALPQPGDTYTLVRTLKNGWFGEDGGFRYYVDGACLTGIAPAEGLYYDFGPDGVSTDRRPCTGLYTLDGATCYFDAGRIATGWQMVGGAWYFFDGAGRGVTGSIAGEEPGVTFSLEGGRLLQGCWLVDASGRRYYNGPEQYISGWKVIGGETYCFENGYARTGVGPLAEEGGSPDRWHEFSPEGVYTGVARDGLYWHGGELYHITAGIPQSTGLYLIDGHYYNFTHEHIAVRSQSYWVYQTNGLDMPRAMYRFDDEGRMIRTSEIVEEDGVLYYYENGPRAEQKGLIQLNGYFYYIGAGGAAAANGAFLVEETNGLIDPPGVYRFDGKGRMLLDTAIVPDADGALQYFHEGCLTVAAGLVLVDGGYYYIQGDGTAVVNTTLWVQTTNGYVEPGEYAFGPDGRLIPRDRLNGIHDGCYYVNDVPTHAGLLKIGENYYYAGPGGEIVTGQHFELVLTNGLLPEGTYEFDENGRLLMHEGLVAREGRLYYYESGRLGKDRGLIEHRAACYYIGADGAALTDVRMQVENTNGLLPPGEYCFGEDGVLFVRRPGDADGSATVDETDAVLLLRFLTGEKVIINRFNADANDDGALNEQDVLLILQYAAGWEVSLQ